MAMYNRSTAAVLDQGIIDAMNQGAGNAYVTVTNRASAQLADGMYRTTNGLACGQWSNSGSDAQKWQIVPAGRYVSLVNKATSMYLDGLSNTTNGSACGQWGYSGSDAQLWLIQPAGGYFTLSNKATGMYIDGIYNYSNGANLGQWGYSGSTAQQWTIGTVGHVQSTAVQREVVGNTPAELSGDLAGGGLRAYPNPFTSAFHLTVDDPAQVKEVVVVDLSGRTVQRIASPSRSMLIGAGLGVGEYIVNVYRSTGVKTFKVIKINK